MLSPNDYWRKAIRKSKESHSLKPLVKELREQTPRRLDELLPVMGLRFSRPVVIFQSDDWGLVGIRDQEGLAELHACGVELGGQPYDSYSLETAEDLRLLYQVLLRHRDSIGRPPCFVFNFIVANVNFPKVVDSRYARLELLPLDEGIPGKWHRPGLIEAYREGIENGLIYPAFHGLTHFCQGVAERTLKGDDDRGRLLRTLYAVDTPLLHSRTPWIRFEYRDDSGWLNMATQRKLIREGVRLFERVFGTVPVTACAPGYRANNDTRRAWAEVGIRVAQNGPGLSLFPYFDRNGLLQLFRNVPFDPALDPVSYDIHHTYKNAQECLAAGKPAVVSVHSINFHSTIRNNRELTLERLESFLNLLEENHTDLIYANDYDLLRIVTDGEVQWKGRRIVVRTTEHWQPSPALKYYGGKVLPMLPFLNPAYGNAV